MKHIRFNYILPVIIIGCSISISASGEKDKTSQLKSGNSQTTVSYGGYIKVDFMLSDYSDGSLSAGSAGRDFYIPSTIPVGGEGGDAEFDAHAKESRFFLKTKTKLGNGDTVSTYIEMDFLVSPGGNERMTNSYNPRVRHAFIKWRSLLAGQTWTTFFNPYTVADCLDFIGPAESPTLARQTMIRYANRGWMFALENPETTLTPYGGGGRIVTDDGQFPDFILRKDIKTKRSVVTIAGLARQLKYDDGNMIDDSTCSYGLSLSGKVMFGKDDLRFSLSSGSGLGRYLGLNLSNGAVISADNKLEAIDLTGAFISYRHFWNSQWYSSLTYSLTTVDNDTDLTGLGVTSESSSIHINLLYTPVPKLLVGAEFFTATRKTESGDDGDLNRLQFSMKYVF